MKHIGKYRAEPFFFPLVWSIYLLFVQFVPLRNTWALGRPGYVVTDGAGAICSPWRPGLPSPIFWLCPCSLLKTEDKTFQPSVTFLRDYNFFSAPKAWTPLGKRTDLPPDSLQSTVVSAVSKLRIGKIAENHDKMLHSSSLLLSLVPLSFPFQLQLDILFYFFKNK